jgi:DNA-binding NarL/FixJ family response regulator
MEEAEPSNGEGSEVIVIDALCFRRAGLMAILSMWARPLGWSLRSADGDDLRQPMPCRLVVLSLGARSISDPDHFRWIKNLSDDPLHPPFVIVSDREDPEEMLGAFGAGARGFLPTSINPEVAFHALTFIAHGGSFFPPSVLLSARRGTGKGARGGQDTSHDPRALT